MPAGTPPSAATMRQIFASRCWALSALSPGRVDMEQIAIGNVQAGWGRRDGACRSCRLAWTLHCAVSKRLRVPDRRKPGSGSASNGGNNLLLSAVPPRPYSARMSGWPATRVLEKSARSSKAPSPRRGDFILLQSSVGRKPVGHRTCTVCLLSKYQNGTAAVATAPSAVDNGDEDAMASAAAFTP